MLQRLAAFLAVPIFAVSLLGQGIDTQASKDDWEEINFDYNSSVLVDGFPSLLRLSELLQKNSGYKVRIEGHTDNVGSRDENRALSQRRAEAVVSYLTSQYNVSPARLEAVGMGQESPLIETPPQTPEARNRRILVVNLGT